MENKKENQKIERVDVYKRSPTFTLDLELLKNYRDSIKKAIMANRLMLMVDGRTLDWVEELITKEKKANPPKEKNQKA